MEDPMTEKETAVDVEATPLFHVVLAWDGEWPVVKSFSTRTEFVAYLKRVQNRPTRAFVFCGRRLLISKGPYRCLLDGEEAPIPLFEVRVCGEADPEDYLWDDPVEVDPDYAAALASVRDPLTAQDESGCRSLLG
jgi:hypothetical protein